MRLGARTLTTTALLLPAFVVSGCSSGTGSTSAKPSASTSPSASSSPSGSSSPSSGAPSASPTGSPPVSPGADGLPGGTAGRDELADGWLDGAGRLYYGEAAPSETKQRALCSYLFGTPAQVARVARLRGTVTLAPRSGYGSLGSNGIGFQCGYAVDGTTTFSLVVWSKKLEGSRTAAHLVETEVGGGRWGYSAYAPAYSGPAVPAATAKRWLTQAGTRVKGS